MNNDDQYKRPKIPNNDPSIAEDALRITCTVCVAGRSEVAFEFKISYDYPFALRKEHVQSSLDAHEALFQLSIVKPAQIAMNEYMEDRFRRGRAKNATGAASAASGVSAPLTGTDQAHFPSCLPPRSPEVDRILSSAPDDSAPGEMPFASSTLDHGKEHLFPPALKRDAAMPKEKEARKAA